MNGLVQFYAPQAGATGVRSWNEAEAVPANPFNGFATPYAVEGFGTYAAGQALRYDVFPYRESGGRIYAGAAWMLNLNIEIPDAEIQWPGWGMGTAWVTGFCVLRLINGAHMGYRDVSAAMMFGGWIDSGGAWSGAGVMPFSFANPPQTARVMWNQPDFSQGPVAMDTVLSPLGGAALSSLLGHRLVRVVSDDLRRSLDGTLAFWFAPAAEASGVAASVRGGSTGKFFADYNCTEGTLSVGSGPEVVISDHQDGDWYLAVFRNSTLSWIFRVDLVRLRDAAQFGGEFANLAAYAALSAEEDYLSEGAWAQSAVGNSGNWGVPGPGYYDRIGIWNRALTDDEVLELFNSGLGWQPE